MARSQNGYPANDRSLIDRFTVPGTGVTLAIRKGTVASVLLYLASQIDASVENIDNARGHLDDWGYAERPVRGGTSLSNHASGTAIDLNATQHPLGKRGTWSKAERAKVHALLKQLGGVVRWGDDYVFRKDGMHFEIVKPVRDVASVVARLGLDRNGVRHKVTIRRTLRKGSRGADVKRVQRLVKVAADEVYGDDTVAGVKRWQRAHGLRADGIFGPASTRRAGWLYDEGK